MRILKFVLPIIFLFSTCNQAFGQGESSLKKLQEYELTGPIKSVQIVRYEPRYTSPTEYSLEISDDLFSSGHSQLFFNKDGLLNKKNRTALS